MIPAVKELPQPAQKPMATIDFSGTHRVERGESLWSIARIYGIDSETLARANNMELNEILREGRLLKTPIK